MGTARSDTLRGTPGRDVICGLGGDDYLIGYGGNDKLLGGAGNDMIDGATVDVVLGEAGNDVLDGGDGADAATTGSTGTSAGERDSSRRRRAPTICMPATAARTCSTAGPGRQGSDRPPLRPPHQRREHVDARK